MPKTASPIPIQAFANIKEIASPKQILALLSYVELTDIVLGIALIMTFFKDLMDFFILFIPYLPTVGLFLSFLMSAFAFIITLLVLLFISGGNISIKQIIIIFFANLLDAIPLVGIFPSATISIIFVYQDILKKRKEAEEKRKEQEAKRQSKLTQAVAQSYAQ